MATPNTGIPYVPEGTQDPAAGLNLALNTIDALLQTAVISIGETAPPVSVDGDLYIVGSSATGAWDGEDNNLARYVGEGDFWQFFVAGDQVRLILNLDDGGLYSFEGTWSLVSGLPDAPSDGVGYVRKDGAWEPESGGGGGSGDVVGPASSVADRVAVFDGTTGKLIKDGGKTIAEVLAPVVQSVASATTVTPAFGNDLVKITAQAAALNLANPSGTAIDGWGVVIRIKDNGTARAVTYGTQYRPIGVTLPTTTVPNKTMYIAGAWNAEDTRLDVLAVGAEP